MLRTSFICVTSYGVKWPNVCRKETTVLTHSVALKFGPLSYWDKLMFLHVSVITCTVLSAISQYCSGVYVLVLID